MTLKEGDVIQISIGDEVYTMLPRHCIYTNEVGNFKETERIRVSVGNMPGGLRTDWLEGKYIVTGILEEGDCIDPLDGRKYPNGQHICCQHAHQSYTKIDFYQSVTFQSMIKNALVIGRAKAIWHIYEEE